MKHACGAALDDYPAATRARLERFVEVLIQWNGRINLVSSRDLSQLWPRHIADSLQLAPFLADDAGVIDLGSGAGFPGLVLAICTANPVTLIESDTRKASFLREAARRTETRVTVVNSRIESAGVPPASIITARALAALPRLLEWAVPLLKPNGRCLFLKGRKVEDELTDARAKWQMTVTRTPSWTDPEGVILTLSQIRPLDAYGSPGS